MLSSVLAHKEDAQGCVVCIIRLSTSPHVKSLRCLTRKSALRIKASSKPFSRVHYQAKSFYEHSPATQVMLNHYVGTHICKANSPNEIYL